MPRFGPSSRVLDVGSGTGGVLAIFRELYRQEICGVGSPIGHSGPHSQTDLTIRLPATEHWDRGALPVGAVSDATYHCGNVVRGPVARFCTGAGLGAVHLHDLLTPGPRLEAICLKEMGGLGCPARLKWMLHQRLWTTGTEQAADDGATRTYQRGPLQAALPRQH